MNQKPNIVMIMVDEMRGDAMGFAGHPDVKTPHLDTLAAQGVYKPVDIIVGNEEQHIDHIFLNTARVEVVEHSFLNDRIVLDDCEHRYSDHDPFVVIVKYK